MYREKIRDSEEFNGLKEKDEELLPGTRNTEAVRGVQNFLNEEGVRDSKGEKLTVDGIYGASTANAVMNYQRANGLSADGIVGDKTWSSIYNRKKKREENASFEESLKSKSGGFFYDRIQNIRKAQRDLGITPSGEIDEESDSKDDFHDRVRRQWETEKNPDVWKTPKIENFPYKPGTRQEPWGRNIPNKPGEPWREKMPDVQAKPLGKYVPNRGQEPWNTNAPRETKGIYKLGSNNNRIEFYDYATGESEINDEKPYTFPESTYEALGEYEPAGEYFLNTESKETQPKEMTEPEKKEILDAKRELKAIATKQYPGIILGVRVLGGVGGNLGVDLYLNKKISLVTKNKNFIKEMAEKHGVPADIIGGIIFKEQLTQSLPDFLVYKWHEKDGSDHSTGLGAIQIRAAKDAWNMYDSSKLERLDDSAIMHKLMTDDKFNIETIALVLINKAMISGDITAYDEARELSYEQWSEPITLYNGSSEYTKKVMEYLPYIDILLK